MAFRKPPVLSTDAARLIQRAAKDRHARKLGAVVSSRKMALGGSWERCKMIHCNLQSIKGAVLG